MDTLLDQRGLRERRVHKTFEKKGEYPTSPYKLYAQVQNGVLRFVSVSTQGSVSYSIPTVGAVGYDVSESGVESKPGYRYGDSVGIDVSDDFDASEMMVQYNFYQKQDFPTKDPEEDKPDVTPNEECIGKDSD